MLPPVDPTVLQRNPNFEILYKDICTRKLGPDGSTRDTKKQRMHDEIRRNLTTARTQVFESQILIQTLSDLASKAGDLPSEIHAVMELVAAQLNGHIPESDREILAGDVSFFLENKDMIGSAMSAQLHTISSQLSQIASASVSPSKKPPEIDRLAAASEELRHTATRYLPEELAAGRVELAHMAYRVLTTHRLVLETSIRILEQTMHGSLARATKTSAEYLLATAKVLGLQARMHTHAYPPPAEFVAALKNFRASQGASEAALGDREGLATRSLELYERAGERAMKDIAKRAMYLREETERVREEMGRLEGGR